MHAKQVNPCRPVGSLFFHDKFASISSINQPWIGLHPLCLGSHKFVFDAHGFSTEASAIPTIRRARPLSMARPLIGSHCRAFHRNFMFTETLEISMFTETCLLQPPVIRTQPDQLHALQRIQTTKSTEILGFKNEQPGKQTPKLKVIGIIFSMFFSLLVPIHNQDKPCFSDGTQFLQTHKDAGNVLPAMGQVLI